MYDNQNTAIMIVLMKIMQTTMEDNIFYQSRILLLILLFLLFIFFLFVTFVAVL